MSYQPLIEDILEPIGILLKDLAASDGISEQYPGGLDVLTWIQSTDAQPPNEYLISAPVSFPLIGLLQLIRFKAVCMSLGITPDELPERFEGLSGHSQGVIVATAISTATSWTEYCDAAVKAVKILFWIGARSSQAFKRKYSQPTQIGGIIQGTPSPMLAISNLTCEDLETAILKVNHDLPRHCHVHLALVNTLQDFVVSGPELTLNALGGSLIASKSASSVSLRFLPISVPCHSPLLDDTVSQIEKDLHDVSLVAGQLRQIVNLTSSGSSIASGLASQENLVPSLIRSITSDLVGWTGVAFGGATHIIDFGPGSTGGIGSLT
ncbi:hypothetical protein EK21DRAFT_63808, partial [Setomelanomma holmii]